jgi:hypothetical protein
VQVSECYCPHGLYWYVVRQMLGLKAPGSFQCCCTVCIDLTQLRDGTLNGALCMGHLQLKMIPFVKHALWLWCNTSELLEAFHGYKHTQYCAIQVSSIYQCQAPAGA